MAPPPPSSGAPGSQLRGSGDGVPALPLRATLGTWTRIGWLSFGGPVGQIALMHRVLVEEKRWIDERRFLHALNYCMLLPGPEAQQLATYVGWLLHGTRGGLAAGLLFILPGALCVLALSATYALFQEAPAVEALFFGLKAAVLAVVLEALLRVGRRVLGRGLARLVALLAFVALFFLALPFPLIVLAAGLLGLAVGRGRPGLLLGDPPPDSEGRAPPLPLRAALARTLRVGLTWLALWWLPLGALSLLLGREHVLAREATFFSRTAVVTFGGAYAVLGYVAQRAVEAYGWLHPGEMLDGLGLAETTPGPLILVLEFVGFLAAYRAPGALPPLLAGCLGAAVTLWSTFAPCFLWIFVGAPWIEALRGRRAIEGALACITAAVVGVIANLALWFGLHVLFGRVEQRQALGLRLLVPDPGSLDLAALALTALASCALLWWKLGLVRTLLLGAGLGLAWRLLG